MKAFITGKTEEGIVFIKTTPEEVKNLTLDMEVDISIGVKVANPIKKHKDDDEILVFHFEDYDCDTRTIKITKRQYNFLKELTDMSSGGYIDLDTWDEGYPEVEETDLTDMC